MIQNLLGHKLGLASPKILAPIRPWADARQDIRSKAVEQILKIRHNMQTRKLAEEEQSRLKKERQYVQKAENFHQAST